MKKQAAKNVVEIARAHGAQASVVTRDNDHGVCIVHKVGGTWKRLVLMNDEDIQREAKVYK